MAENNILRDQQGQQNRHEEVREEDQQDEQNQNDEVVGENEEFHDAAADFLPDGITTNLFLF